MQKTVKIGKYEIAVSRSHILLDPTLPPTYDYVPWNLIGGILSETCLMDSRLIDIGANVGDSLAFFRRFSQAPALCVEPDEEYFAILSENAKILGNADLRNALVSPDDLVGKTFFATDGQTGNSRRAVEGETAFQGDHISSRDIMRWADGRPTVIKTDTDGFDADIIRSILPYLSQQMVPLIFFEGPTYLQSAEQDVDAYIEVCRSLQNMGYKFLVMTNIGMPYVYVGTNVEALTSCFRSHSAGIHRQKALCHYYDFIALHPALTSLLHSLQASWGEEMFFRQ
ncbi:FkbM family methyltransferase [Agrobacterium rosae]|uniref:FkbM family methyltransferase n=1 Tax=Agrobacterium rosae TaxID=1972867 RepID=UPI002A0C48CF|nr:FkbM family methyltransferase [Agrobacterium rosae]MDX8315573.1 FkbM family methyltransferase [Agrobacterium rosae]